MTTTPDIFLSYSREDQARATLYAEGFERAGFKVWWDVGLRTGEAYDQVTEKALRDAKAVVVLWSKRSVESRWVRAEATLADRNKTLAPCMIEPCERPIMFELTQTAELSHWRGETDDHGWQSFLTDVRRFVDYDAPTPLAGPSPNTFPIAHDERPSLAVLPFANLSGDIEQDYFADGMKQEITTALTRIRSIFVIASASTQGLTGKDADPQAVGRRLGVRYVLQGSARRAGPRIRVSVTLVDAANGTQVWADRYDDTMEDVFALQDRVALSVAGVIEPAVREAEIRRAVRRPTADASGYDLYLRALALIDTFEKTPMFEAIALLGEAVERDPKYALAMSLAAYAHAQVWVSRWADDVEAHRVAARDLAQRAVQLGGDDADVLSWVVGAYLALQEDAETSRILIERSIALNPGSAQAWMMSGWVHMTVGDGPTAISHLETAMRLDPLSPDRGYHLGGIAFARFGMGQFEETLRLLKEVIHLQPTVSMNLALLTACYGHLGQARAAQAIIARYREASQIDMRDRLPFYRDAERRKLFLDGLELAGAKPSLETGQSPAE